MCEFFSFSVDRDSNVYAILGEDRQKAILQNQNPDSHSYISDFFGLDEDQTWKFEISLDKGDIDTLCQGGVPEKLQIDDIDTLRRWYDGGIPINEMPLDVAEATIKWLCEHLEEIKEAGRLKFSSPLAEQIFASEGQEVITLSIARQRGQLALELAKYIVGQGWGWDEGQVATLIQGSKGWGLRWEKRIAYLSTPSTPSAKRAKQGGNPKRSFLDTSFLRGQHKAGPLSKTSNRG